MSSSLGTVEYIADLLSPIGNVVYKKLFGEYGLYSDRVIFALVCDDCLFIKITDEAEKAFPSLEKAPPYDGAKEYFLFEDIDNSDFLCELVKLTLQSLPEPKTKKRLKQ